MKFTRTAAVALGAVAIALSPTAAMAHGDKTTFDNCTDAYEHGHANILEGSVHYEDKLDRDQDSKGCDTPPADFVEYEGDEEQEQPQESTPQDSAAEPNLAETGGDAMTAYYAAGGAVVLLAGATVLVVSRKRRTDS